MSTTYKKQKINPIRYYLKKLGQGDSTTVQRSLACLGIVVTLGILVHDTKFDKAVSLALPVAVASFGLSAHAIEVGENAHTHVERVSTSHYFSQGSPRIHNRDKRFGYVLPKCFGRTSSNIGGSQVVWPSV